MDYILNVSAFCLPLLLFSYWGVVGYATLTLLRSQRHTMQNLLFAPIMGFAVTLLFTFTINRFGMPINHFAIILSSVLIISSITLIYFRKPLFPFQYYRFFALIFFLALCFIGSPLLQFGFDWISFGNDDMANYVLGAKRFLNYGFFDVPDVNQLIQKKDLSLLYWFWHVPGILRSGSEIMLAWVSGLTRLNPVQIFMPTIIAFHLVLISTTGALVYTSRKYHSLALTSCLLLSFSALTAFGIFYQLITQVIGLALLVACTLLLCQAFTIHRKYYGLREGILIGLIVSALIIMYVELFPFLAATCFTFFAIHLLLGWRPTKVFGLIVFTSIVSVLILTNIYLIAAIEFIVREYGVMAESAVVQLNLFPYFLLPSGFANLWGFLGITAQTTEPYLSIAIISGIVLTLMMVLMTLKFVFTKRFLPAIMLVVMMGLAINLIVKKYGFGLFKLSMYAQPFFISVIGLSIFELIKKASIRKVLVVTLILSNLGAFSFYLTRSKGTTPGSFTEIAYASPTKLNQEYRNLVSTLPQDALLLSDDFNISLIRLQALQSTSYRFVPLSSPSNFITGQLPERIYLFPNLHSKLFNSKLGMKLAVEYAKNGFYSARFQLLDPKNTSIDFIENKFCTDTNTCRQGFIVADAGLRSIFNRRSSESLPKTQNFVLKKLDETNNHLVFIDSSLGRVYHSLIADNMNNISLYNIEIDPMYPDNSMQAVGRYLLMKVFNPTDSIRMEMTLTNTFNGDKKNKLPTLSAIGSTKATFPVMGRGSARIVSVPFSPQIIKGMPYVVMNMDGEYIQFPNGDTRQIVTFARDISLITNEDYQQLNLPNEIKDFPKDLANSQLEYSGIYEDGWISEDSFVRLMQPNAQNQLIIQGMLPKIDSTFTGATLTVVVNGKKIAEQNLQPGDFRIDVPVTTDTLKHKVELHFNKAQILPNGDGRPIGAKIKYIGFS